MEKETFSDAEIKLLRDGFNPVRRVNPAIFNERVERIFSGCTSDAVCQLAKAKIKFVSTAAYFEAKKRGITLENFRLTAL